MLMRNFYVAVIVVIHAAGTGTGTSIIPRRANKGDRDPRLVQRDAIVESVYLQHPEWPSDRVYNEVYPLIEAAGLPVFKPGSLRVQLCSIAKKHKIKRSWGGIPSHTAYLRHLYAKDPSQTPAEAWAKFEARWGKGVEDAGRVETWWRDANDSHRRKGARKATAGGSRPPSPTDASLPADWWELGDAFNQYLFSDSSNAAHSPTAGPSQKKRIGKKGTRQGLKQRNAIVESVLHANPTWTAGQIHKAATPLILAAGFDPIGVQSVRKLAATISEGRDITYPTYAPMKPEHVAFLRAHFDRDPNQLANDVSANFQAVFGQNAENLDRITVWWNNHRGRSFRKQSRMDTVAGGRSGSPRPSTLSLSHAGSPRVSSPPRVSRSRSPTSVRPSTSGEAASAGLPLEWWALDPALDQFVDTPQVDANGVLLDPWSDIQPANVRR